MITDESNVTEDLPMTSLVQSFLPQLPPTLHAWRLAIFPRDGEPTIKAEPPPPKPDELIAAVHRSRETLEAAEGGLREAQKIAARAEREVERARQVHLDAVGAARRALDSILAVPPKGQAH